MSDTDPRCPECGGRIGQTATYCMHCQADLGSRGSVDDSASGATEGWQDDDQGGWADDRDGRQATDQQSPRQAGGPARHPPPPRDDSQLLDPDGIVDNTLTVVVGLVGGLVVGLVGTIELLLMTESLYSVPVGVIAWIAATAHLVRRRTVQSAVSRSAYGVALVLLVFPLITLSPIFSVEGGIEGRISGFLGILAVVAIPATLAAIAGYVAGMFVPDDA